MTKSNDATKQPFYRTVRQFADGSYSEGGRSQYVRHPKFAVKPSSYVRAYEILQEDFMSLFEYVEPADQNLETYSIRIYELLLRTCTEVETNLKAILRANKYSKRGNLTIVDYYRVNTSHYLSDYEVLVPYWTGTDVRQPFKAWANRWNQLPWYDAYNQTKHDRVGNLHLATLDHLTNAMCGLVVVLAAQFYTYDFAPRDDLLSVGGINDGREGAIGHVFRVQFPQNVPMADRYDFDWQALSTAASPFVKFDYDVLP